MTSPSPCRWRGASGARSASGSPGSGWRRRSARPDSSPARSRWPCCSCAALRRRPGPDGSRAPGLSDIRMETLASHTPISNVPLTLRRRNGSTVPIELSTAPLKGGEGKDVGVIGVLRDLTLVRQLEHDLRRSDQLAALGTLAAGLAHEIKNPLTSLLTFTRHLERRFDDPHFREKFHNVVPRELERINGIVERLLELARPARMSLALVRLPVLLDRVVELYGNQIEARQIVVVREYARDVPPLQADAAGARGGPCSRSSSR